MKLKTSMRFLPGLCMAPIMLAFSVPLIAQDEPDGGEPKTLEEVKVTAQKREQSLQDVPLTVTAFGGEFLTEFGVQDIRDIAGMTPNVSIKARGETESSVFIRGIGSVAPGIGADPAVGIFIDGMVASRGTNATAAFFDVERIEVIKGPQGTLFGRNASAGAISIITNKPDLTENSGSVMVGFGDNGQFRTQLIGNMAVSDRFAIRVGVNYDKRDGLYYNELTDQELLNVDNTNWRISALGMITDSWESTFLVEGIDAKNNDAVVTDADAFAENVRLNPAPAKQMLESTRFIWTNKWDFDNSTQLTSITGYYDHDVNVTPVDADETEFPIMTFQEPQTNKTFSQELRLNGSSDRVDWFVGASYVHEDLSFIDFVEYDESIVLPLFGLDICQGPPDGFDCPIVTETPEGRNKTKSYAIYGEFTWQATDRVSLTAGARYTNDKKDMVYNNPPTDGVLGLFDAMIFGPATDGNVYGSDSWNHFDPRVAMDFAATDNTTLFVNIASGFKSGGLNRQVDDFLPNPQTLNSFDEETVIAYEVGSKSRLLDGRATLNFSAFYSDYKDYQLETLVGLVPEVFNIGDIDSKGIEIEGRILVTDNFDLGATFAYLNSKISKSLDPSLVGNNTPQSPDYSGSFSGNYYIPISSGEVKLSAIWTYSDSFWFDVFNELEQPSYNTLDLRVGFTAESGRWGIAAFADNVTDTEYYSERFLFLDVANRRAAGRLFRAEATFWF